MLNRSDSSPRQGLLTASLRFGLRPALRASKSAPGGFVPGSRMQDSTYVRVLWIPAIHAGITWPFDHMLAVSEPALGSGPARGLARTDPLS